MSKIELMSRLWKQHQDTNLVFKFPVSKIKDVDNNIIVNYAHVVLQSFSLKRDMNVVEFPKNVSPSVYDFKATIFTYDRNGTPIQYKPIFIPESLVISNYGTIAKNKDLLKRLVKSLRNEIKKGVTRETKLLPAISNNDIDIIMDSAYYNGRISFNGQMITEEQKDEIGDDPINFLEPGYFGKQSLIRFIEKITTIQSPQRLEKRKLYLPTEFYEGIKTGYPIQPREVSSLIIDKHNLQLEEQTRIVNGLSDFIFNLDYDLIEKLRQVNGASPDGYVFFKTNTPKEITTKEGKELIYPRKEILQNYPLLANMIGKNSNYQFAVDNLKNLAPLITNTLASRGDTETQVGKKLLKRILRKNIVTSQTGEEFLQSFSAIPSDSFPEIPETFNSDKNKTYAERTDWDNMEACVACINEIAKATGNPREKMFKDVKGDWAGYRQRIAKASSNTRIPQGMTEELFNEIMKKLPIDRWKNEIDKDKVRQEIIEEVHKLEPMLPGDVLSDDVIIWLTSQNAPFDDVDTLIQHGKQVEDMINIFTSKVTLPLSAKISGVNDAPITPDILIAARKASVDILFSTPKSPIQILKMSHDFHANLNNFLNIEGVEGTENNSSIRSINDITSDSLSNDVFHDTSREALGLDNYYEWVPLVSRTYEAPNGFKIIPLLTSQDLKTEGKIMSHCVGTYTKTCSSGKSRIFSVIDQDYNRTTTLELSLNYDEQQVTINQNQSYGNGSGRDENEKSRIKEAKKASEWFKQNINDGIIPTEWSLIEDEKNMKREDKKQKNNKDYIAIISEDAGYSPSNINIIRKAILPWKQYMSKKHKQFSIRDFETIKSIRETARAINMDYKTNFDKEDVKNEINENNGPSISWINKKDVFDLH